MAHCAFLAMLRPLHSVTNKEQYKKLDYTRYRKYGWKAYTAWGKPYCTIANWHLALSAKRTGTSTGTQRMTKVSPWCMHCTSCGWWKGTSRDKVTSNNEEIKPVATWIHCWVTLGWRHEWVEWVSEWVIGVSEWVEWVSEWMSELRVSAWVSESVIKIRLNRKFLKFHKNMLEGFRVTLKAFLGLAKFNQYSQAVLKEDWVRF